MVVQLKNSMTSTTVVLALAAVFLTAAAESVAQDRQSVIVVVGAEGAPEYGVQFSEWADRWQSAANAGGADLKVIGRDDVSNDLQELMQQLSETSSIQTSEPLWLVLIGHGTFDSRVAQFNLRGKDLAAGDLAEKLAAAQRPIVVINCSSCSSPFINSLSGPGRVVISATKDGSEIQFSRFGGFLSEAIGGLEADIDRDGQTSVLEAWLFAARRTAEYYESEGRLATEHSLLDDSGDAKGTRFELFQGVRPKDSIKNKSELDGGVAKRWHLVRSELENSLTVEQRLERDRLEDELEQLRERKVKLTEEAYLDELEKLLVPLARIYAAAESPTP